MSQRRSVCRFLWFILGVFAPGLGWLAGCASPQLPPGELQILASERSASELPASETTNNSDASQPDGPDRDRPPADRATREASQPLESPNLIESRTEPLSEPLASDHDFPDPDQDQIREPDPDLNPDPGKPDDLRQDRQVGDSAPAGVGTPCRVNQAAGICREIQDCTGDQRAVPGFCPGPTHVQCCIPNTSGVPDTSSGSDMSATPDTGNNYCAVKIPASCQPVSAFAATCNCSVAPPTPSHAGKREKPGQNGCPDGMVRVDQFCIDQYEAALVEILPGGQTQAWSPFLNPGNRKIKAVSIAGVIPQGYISGTQAARACKAAGKRLCTDTEWLRACQSAQKYTFPYGNTKQKGWCNEDRALHPAVEYFGHARSCVFSYISHICINQLPNSLAPTGSFSQCVTAEGAYDMMGNLHEWTADPTGTFRGGYYVDTYRNGPGCLYRTTAHTVGHWDYSTGFRCCADLKP